jgi:hypothetical protein
MVKGRTMTQHEFDHFLGTIKALSPEQMRRVRRQIDRELAHHAAPADAAHEETAFDVADRAGLIGCIKGGPRSPTDLSTNPKHMQGFGRG